MQLFASKTHLCYISVAFVFCYDELCWAFSFVFAPLWFPIGFHHFDSSLLCWRTQQPRKVFLEQQQSMTKEFQSHRNRRSFDQVQLIWLVILQINPHTRKTFNKLYDNLFMLLKLGFHQFKDVIVYCKILFAFVKEN